MENAVDTTSPSTELLNVEMARVEALIAHRVGNKHNGQAFAPAADLLEIASGDVLDLLHTYFLKPFRQAEHYHFTSDSGNLADNLLYGLVSEIFSDEGIFLDNSVEIARLLFEKTVHPQIKSGDLFVAAFSNVAVSGVDTRALGIFKSESLQKFLKLTKDRNGYDLSADKGINVNKLDKGCLIFDLEGEQGYRVALVDRVNKGQDAQFWKDHFLQLRPRNDSFHKTREVMQRTREFLVDEAPFETTLSKAEQIDLLNRTADYFKENSKYVESDFQEAVFQQPEVRDAYRQYNAENTRTMPDEVEGGFDISTQAVKKFAKTYKSVLKLDKNFHVYIHGDRELIQQGTEDDGRKFYKIYFNEEH